MISCVHWKGPDENANDACSSVSAVAIKLLISCVRRLSDTAWKQKYSSVDGWMAQMNRVRKEAPDDAYACS